MQQLLIEFFPILIFFVLYRQFDLIVATIGLIAVTAMQLIYAKYRRGRIERQQWITFLVLLFFGGLTVAFDNPRFLQWKVSIINWGFALACVLSARLTQKTLLEHLMGHQLSLSQAIWKKMSRMWFVFFTGMGFLNLIVAYQCSVETWVSFKLFGVLGLTFVFMLFQSFYLIKHAQEKKIPYS